MPSWTKPQAHTPGVRLGPRPFSVLVSDLGDGSERIPARPRTGENGEEQHTFLEEAGETAPGREGPSPEPGEE